MTKLLSIDAILTCPDLEEKDVKVTEWKGAVRIRGFSKARQQQIRKDAMVGTEINSDRFEMLMFIHGVIEPQFTEAHYEQLREKSASAIDRVLQEIMNISGMATEAAVKQAEKNFRIQ